MKIVIPLSFPFSPSTAAFWWITFLAMREKPESVGKTIRIVILTNGDNHIDANPRKIRFPYCMLGFGFQLPYATDLYLALQPILTTCLLAHAQRACGVASHIHFINVSHHPHIYRIWYVYFLPAPISSRIYRGQTISRHGRTSLKVDLVVCL